MAVTGEATDRMRRVLAQRTQGMAQMLYTSTLHMASSFRVPGPDGSRRGHVEFSACRRRLLLKLGGLRALVMGVVRQPWMQAVGVMRARVWVHARDQD